MKAPGQSERLPLLDHQRIDDYIAQGDGHRRWQQRGEQQPEAAGLDRRQQAEYWLDRPGYGEKCHQSAENGGQFTPVLEERADRLRDEPGGRIANALHEIERCKENISACYACHSPSSVTGRRKVVRH